MAGNGFVPAGPHTHMETKPRAVGAVHDANVVAVELLQGAILIALAVPEVIPPRFCETTVMIPVVAVVEILATYLLVELVDSQPHESAAAGKVAAVWIVSVIPVRQADAAKITSDTLARTV